MQKYAENKMGNLYSEFSPLSEPQQREDNGRAENIEYDVQDIRMTSRDVALIDLIHHGKNEHEEERNEDYRIQPLFSKEPRERPEDQHGENSVFQEMEELIDLKQVRFRKGEAGY